MRTFTTISLRAADLIGDASVVQLRALTVLSSDGQINLAELATHMGVTSSTASRLVDRLVAADLADRRIAGHSRRDIALQLTAKGRATLDTYDRLRLAEIHAHLATLTEERQRSSQLPSRPGRRHASTGRRPAEPASGLTGTHPGRRPSYPVGGHQPKSR